MGRVKVGFKPLTIIDPQVLPLQFDHHPTLSHTGTYCILYVYIHWYILYTIPLFFPNSPPNNKLCLTKNNNMIQVSIIKSQDASGNPRSQSGLPFGVFPRTEPIVCATIGTRSASIKASSSETSWDSWLVSSSREAGWSTEIHVRISYYQ
jgi:hypothetical protein